MSQHHFCSYDGCGVLVEGHTRCENHRKRNRPTDYRGSAGKPIERGGRGYDWKWRKVRDAYLAKNPLCERCIEAGQPVTATIVHHKIEVEKAPHLRLNSGNLQSVCASCHQLIHQGNE